MGRIVDYDIRLFLVEQLKQQVDFVGQVVGVVAVVLALVHIERERLRTQRVSANADNHGRIGVVQEI